MLRWSGRDQAPCVQHAGPKLLQRLSRESSGVAHSPAPPEMRKLFTDAGFTITSQRRVDRPMWTPVWDNITVGAKPED